MGRSIKGRVVNRLGTPVPGVTVMITDSDQPHPDIAALTDASGAFRLNGLKPGTYTLGANGLGLNGGVRVRLSSTRQSKAEILLA